MFFESIWSILACFGFGWILPLVKQDRYFLGPWLLVCQFMEISNQMEQNDEVTNFKQKDLFNTQLLYNFFSKFET